MLHRAHRRAGLQQSTEHVQFQSIPSAEGLHAEGSYEAWLPSAEGLHAEGSYEAWLPSAEGLHAEGSAHNMTPIS